MEIGLDNLHQFVRQHGAQVSIVDSKGNTRLLREGEPDIWDLVQKADKFQFEGKWYSRDEFSKLMDERSRPANITQAPPPSEAQK